MRSRSTLNFFTKLLHWEYWPFQLVYFPVSFYWLWCWIRTGSPFFFSAANPGIPYGGMLYDPKYPILLKFNRQFIPETLLVKKNTDPDTMRSSLSASDISFPLIAKPDIGERGVKVEKIYSTDELDQYHQNANYDYLIQEFIDLPLEIGVFYYRFPGEEQGTVSSVVVKEMLQITGDGVATVEELMNQYPRARLQVASLSVKNPELMRRVPAQGEKLELESIGNHNRGTTFLNGNELINEDMLKVIEDLAKMVPGFYFGRFDLRCASVEDLYRGENFKILELNGAKSEPAHIYQPGFPILKAYSSIFKHWKIMYRISRINHLEGFKLKGFWKCLPIYREYLGYLKMLKSS